MVKELFVFRHGDVEQRDVCKGNKCDVPLSIDGQWQTAENMRVAQEFARDRSIMLFTSPLERCRDAGKHFDTSDVCIVPELCDIDIGDLEGLSHEEVERRHPGLLAQLKTDARPIDRLPGATESTFEFRRRQMSVLQSTILECRSDVVVVVTHGCNLEELCASMRANGQAIRYLTHPPASAAIARMEEGQLRLLGERKHLYNGDQSFLWDLFRDTSSLSPDPQA